MKKTEPIFVQGYFCTACLGRLKCGQERCGCGKEIDWVYKGDTRIFDGAIRFVEESGS